MRLPSFFDNSRINLQYKLGIKKNRTDPDEMILVFERQFKKEFFISIATQAMKKISKKKHGLKSISSFSGTRDELEAIPGVLKVFDKKFSAYVQQIRTSWKLTHPAWFIYKHEFSSIEFLEKQKNFYDMKAIVKIWVSKGERKK